jgi:hypothetical protein
LPAVVIVFVIAARAWPGMDALSYIVSRRAIYVIPQGGHALRKALPGPRLADYTASEAGTSAAEW